MGGHVGGGHGWHVGMIGSAYVGVGQLAAVQSAAPPHGTHLLTTQQEQSLQ